jgi:histone H3/H4
MIREFATDFQPPQQAVTGGTGLYAGEQDIFMFLIDPLGWVEIEGENYAPGFFVWNSETGRRALGCQTFWFQAVCQNHIVWDATEITEYTRKHTARVRDGLGEIRAMIEATVAKRDARKDGFVTVIRKAMETKLGDDAEEAFKELCKNGISRSVAKEAITIAQEKGRFTIWSLVDALTRLSQESRYVGDRVETDQKASQLLSLVA